MKNRADRYVLAGERDARAALGEAADPDDDPRLQQLHDVAQRLVARTEERLRLRCRQLVGRAVRARSPP